jgi:TPR repeat protein
VVQDAALAAQWWRLAAEAGDAIPQYRLGNLFEQGLGVSQDREAAMRWYRNAAARGNRDAAAALLRLGAN